MAIIFLNNQDENYLPSEFKSKEFLCFDAERIYEALTSNEYKDVFGFDDNNNNAIQVLNGMLKS